MNASFKAMTIFACVIVIATPALAAKPVPPPPPPPPPYPEQTCAGAPGVFPAFAYLKDRYRTVVSRKGVSTQVLDGNDLYLADSTGSCSLPIARNIEEFSYRQIGTEGRIAWVSDWSAIKLIKFHVVDGGVLEPRPIPSDDVFLMDIRAIGGLDLSRDGQTIYYPEEVRTVDLHWQSSIRMIDLSACPNCAPQLVYTLNVDNSAGRVEINDAEDRIYFSIHDRKPDIRTVSFLEKQSSSWSPSTALLRHVVSNQDLAYSTVDGLANVAVGKWDYNGSGVLSDVIAFVVERAYMIDIADVSNCSASGVSSCLSSGESSVLRNVIPGTHSSFIFAPDGTPKLLVGGDSGGWVRQLDLDTQVATPLVQGYAADSAD